MEINNFIAELQDILEFETKLEIDTNLHDVEEWDSLSAMVLMGYVSDTFEVKITPADLEKMESISALIDKIGREKFVK